MSFRLPRWLRVVVFVLVVALAVGGGLRAAQEMMKPVTLTLAAGSVDGEVVRLMTAISSRLAANKAPVRITIVDKGTPAGAAKAFAAGEAQLAVVRSDNDSLASARTVVQLANLVVLVVVPAHSPVKSIGDLKGRTVGVVGLPVNQRLLNTLVRSYGFADGMLQFVDVPLDQLGEASRAKKHQAVIFTLPLSERYVAMARAFFPATNKSQPRILEIEPAEAIALETKHYEQFDLPKGAIRGAPPVPDDSVSTLRVPLYLVAGAKVSDDAVSALAKAIMEVKRDLAGEAPLLSQIAAPEDDSSAPIPIHPGAKAFFDGSEKSWSDKYGDWLFYGPIVLGMVGSFLAGLWKFLQSDGGTRTGGLLQRITALIERTRKAGSASEMEEIERESDAVLDEYFAAQVQGQIDADHATRINMMIQHMESAIERRSQALKLQQGAPVEARA